MLLNSGVLLGREEWTVHRRGVIARPLVSGMPAIGLRFEGRQVENHQAAFARLGGRTKQPGRHTNIGDPRAFAVSLEGYRQRAACSIRSTVAPVFTSMISTTPSRTAGARIHRPSGVAAG